MNAAFCMPEIETGQFLERSRTVLTAAFATMRRVAALEILRATVETAGVLNTYGVEAYRAVAIWNVYVSPWLR